MSNRFEAHSHSLALVWIVVSCQCPRERVALAFVGARSARVDFFLLHDFIVSTRPEVLEVPLHHGIHRRGTALL